MDLPDTSPLIKAAADAAPLITTLLEAHGLKWHPPESEEKATIITPPGQLNYYEWYAALGSILRPQRVLEIGVFGGASMLSLCSGAGGSVEAVWLIDDESYGLKLTDAAARIRKVVSSTCVVLADVGDSQRMAGLFETKNYDVISIDGDHRVGPCFHDLRISLPLLAPHGHIIVDDANWEWVRYAVDAFMDDHRELSDLTIDTYTGTRILHYGMHVSRCPLLGEIT